MKSVFLVIAIASVAILGIADAFAMLKWGPDQTFSAVFFGAATSMPVIPFLMGYVAGHLTWPLAKDTIQK